MPRTPGPLVGRNIGASGGEELDGSSEGTGQRPQDGLQEVHELPSNVQGT